MFMKKVARLMGALAFAVCTLGAVALPSQADALTIDISRDPGESAVQPAPSHNNHNNNGHNNNHHNNTNNNHNSHNNNNNSSPVQNINAARMSTKLDTIFASGGVVNFNYTITNVGNFPGSVTKISYTGTLTVYNNSYPFEATGIVSNCYIAPQQSAHITISFKDARFGNYQGNVGSKGSSNTTWTTHRQ